MINEVIRERVAASGFAPEHVDAVATRLTEVAEAATKAACQKYIDASVLVLARSDDHRFGAILSIAMGQPRSDTSGRPVQRFSSTNGYKLSWFDRDELVRRYGQLSGLTDDPAVLAWGAGLVADPFPFRFVDGAGQLPRPLDRYETEEESSDENDEDDPDGGDPEDDNNG